MQDRPLPPLDLLHGAALFLDLDGTLLDLIDRPDEVAADDELVALLARLGVTLEGRLAVVSGRSLAQLDRILGAAAAELALSGSHGSEQRWQGVEAHPHRPASLNEAAERMRPLAAELDGVLVEEKSFGVALHYRMAPHAEERACALVETLAREFGLLVQQGKMMVELRVPGGDKGKAIAALMRQPTMRGSVPVFAGDDLTDEPGFEIAAELGGCGILVGPDRPSAARYRLNGPAELRNWLSRASV